MGGENKDEEEGDEEEGIRKSCPVGLTVLLPFDCCPPFSTCYSPVCVSGQNLFFKYLFKHFLFV